MKLLDYFSKNVGIDLGTANSLVYVAGRGIVVNEPSIVAINNKTGQILAVGEEARKMVGRTPNHINVVRPLTAGVISDFDVTQEMLRHYLKKVGGGGALFSYRKAVIGVPSNLTEVSRKSVEDAGVGAGVTKAYIIEEPIAAALGARLPIDEPAANMIVDIGGGTTEVAIISIGGAVTSKSLKIAGDKFNSDIIKFIRDEFNLLIGEPTAEEIKISIGSAAPLDERLELAVRGRDVTSGLPKEAIIKSHQIRTALSRSLRLILDAIRETIENSPPELAGDILKRGIYLCGGGAMIKGIDELIKKEIKVNTIIVDDPLTCVVRGAGIAAENIEEYSQFFNTPLKPMDISL